MTHADTAPAQDTILIVDFGSQVTQLIARRIRETGVYCEIHPFQSAAAAVAALNPRGIVLSGGPASTLDENAPTIDPAVFAANVPILGICYGQQALCMSLGGKVEAGHHREFGRADVHVEKPSALYDGVWTTGSDHQVWMSHGDRVVSIPEGFEVVGTSPNAPFAMIANEARRIWAVQFHPEVVHTPDGAKLYANFVHQICGIQSNWTMSAYRQKMIEKIRAQVGSGKVICGLSGGVDSSVAAVLIHEAIGDQLTCIYVDHGLMRLNESEQVVTMFRDQFNIPLVHVDASKQFLGELEGQSDPETKRKIIGRLFIEVFEEEAKKLGGAQFLAQGTLYPDVIESVSFTGGPSVTIKSHHNVGGLPDDLKFKLVEPLRLLFKDEVRAVGRELGLPEEIVGRQPFPGPGLGIRIVGEVTASRLDTLRRADSIAREELTSAGLDQQIWQCPVVLLADVRSVGVQGDGRTYGHPIVLRPVSSEDAMTADWTRLPYDVLSVISTRITNEVREVNRVVLDVTSKPPGTIEWE